VFCDQDTCFEVRKEFGDKLRGALQMFKLSLRFFPLVFLMAHEPEKALVGAV